MATVDDLPEPFKSLIHTIRAHHPDTGGAFRRARDEFDARLAFAQLKVARWLMFATWALVAATVALVVVALIG